MAAAVALGCCGQALAADDLAIESDRDSRFLPYSADTIRAWPPGGSSGSRSWIHVWQPVVAPATEVRLVEAVDQDVSSASPSAVNLRVVDAASGEVRTLWEHPIRGRIAELITLPDHSGTDGYVLTGVIRSDTAWLSRLSIAGEEAGEMMLGTGADRNGNGRWDGRMEHLRTADYDLDGDPDVFVFLTSSRDLTPRLLMCIDPRAFNVAWSLPVASEIDPRRFFALCDSLRPAVVFTTSNPAQGAADRIFQDRFSYLVRVNATGVIDFNYIVGRYPEPGMVVPDLEGTSLFVFHRLSFLTDPDSAATARPSLSLSKLSADGHPGAAAPVEQVVVDLVARKDSEISSSLYAIMGSGEVRRYDTALNLLGQALSTRWQEVLESGLRLPGQLPGLIVSEQAGGVFLYSRQFERLAYLGAGPAYETVQADTAGHVLALLSGSPTAGHVIYRIRRRNLAAMVSIWYRAYQDYVVAAVAGLLVAIVLVNYFRLRTRSTLKLVAAQKRELQETHEALKRAQAEVLEAEKYRQARDIAGGFAHEIRNALFPARGMLAKLRARASDAQAGDLLGTADESVARAIEITKIISTYAQLESRVAPQPVSVSRAVTDAVGALRYRLDRVHASLAMDGPEEMHVLANHDQLVIVLGNILRNSLDAFASRLAPAIRVFWESAGRNVKIHVQDNGEGIPPEHTARIFDAFYSTRPESGTGLGLTIVKKFVSMYLGSVDVQSTPGEGTKVTITLPIAHAAADDANFKESTS